MQGFDLQTISNCYIGNAQASAIFFGANKIWPIHDYSLDYLTFESLEDDNLIFINGYSGVAIQYSTDDGTSWTSATTVGGNTQLATIDTGEKILIKGNNSVYAQGGNYMRFKCSKQANISGNIMSLIYGDNYIGQVTFPSDTTYNFSDIFSGAINIINAENLILPATTLTTGCYANMFNGCTSLTKAPVLPATILTGSCYMNMFYGCSSLNYIKMLATNIPYLDCLFYWTQSVSATGTFVKDSNTTLPSGASGIPEGWTVINV